MNLHSLVILDRDGVINEDSPDYIKSPEEFIPLPRSLEAIARLQKANKTVVIASNQSGLARGYFDQATLAAIHQKLGTLLQAQGGVLPDIFICPHGPLDGCHCRKPLPGLLEQIASRFGPLQGIPVVGDSLRDLEAAVAVHAMPILVKTGNGLKTQNSLPKTLQPQVFADLSAFVEHYLKVSI